MFERYALGEMQKETHTLGKKIIFIITLSVFVGISMFLSFSSISGSGAEYEPADNGYMLVSYKSNADNNVLCADFVTDEDSTADTAAAK